MTPLLFAVRDGNVAMTRLLLELGADINQASGNHTSPLLIALLNGQVALATELLEKGADPNLADDYHRGALFAAIELRNFNHDKYPFLYGDGRDPLDLIKALLAKGANPNQRTDTTPVHGLMQFDGSWVNFDGQTPFIRAALSGDIQVMRLLLQHGADPNLATNQGSTALMAAAGINWIPAQTFTRSEAEYLEAVKLCLERGADVNATNSLKLAAIHGAANRGWTSIIQILADHGATLDQPDVGGRTPMMFAEGIFLAIRPPVAKPDAIALLKKLMAERPARRRVGRPRNEAHSVRERRRLRRRRVGVGGRPAAGRRPASAGPPSRRRPRRRRSARPTASPATTTACRPAACRWSTCRSTAPARTPRRWRRWSARCAPG